MSIPLHTNDEYLAAAQRFAPVVTFYKDGDEGSEERYYPCSIEFLLAHSTLKRGGLTNYIGINTSAPPGMVYFETPQGNYHIFSRDPNGTGIMHLVSGDGLNGWGPAQGDNINHQTSSGVSAVVFNNQVHLFYRDPGGNGIYHRVSSDGFDFSGGPGWYFGLDCDGTPTATANDKSIVLLACDAGGNGIMWATSTDGVNFAHGYTGFNTNNGVSPGVAWYGNQFHGFFLDHDQDFESGFKKHVGILHIIAPSGAGDWGRVANWYSGADASNGPEAVVAKDRLHLFFRDPNGNGIMHRESTTGDDWGPIDYIGIDCEGKPSAVFNGNDIFVTSQDGGGRGIMIATVSNFPPIVHPTQDDLAQHSSGYFHLDVDPSANAGEIDSMGEITAPMYVAVQTGTNPQDGTYVDITYAMLYAFQGGQPLWVVGVPAGNIIVENYGMHQADLEWVTVRLDPSLSKILKVGYEAHGNIVSDEDSGGWWPTDPDPTTGATYEREGERPIVRVARNGHACRNGWLAQGTGNPIIVHKLKNAGLDGVLSAIELHSTLPSCPTWRPYEKPGGLVPIGLLPGTEPPVSVNQAWALYGGRLGRQQNNPFESATYVNGAHLSASDWAIVKGLATGAQLIGALSSAKIAGEVLNGIGPYGPRDRDFVVNSALTPMQQDVPAPPTPRQPTGEQQSASSQT
jgi:hypothetical protein